jgi:hypothetical protein
MGGSRLMLDSSKQKAPPSKRGEDWNANTSMELFKGGWRVQHVRCKDNEAAFTSFGEAVEEGDN